MAGILSRDELDALLTTGDDEAYRAGAKRVKAYDFRRPDKLSKDQLRTLQMIHENFARLLGTSLSAYLRSLVEIEVLSVEQVPYYEFVQALPNPAAISVIALGPLEGNALFEVHPDISFSIIDRLLGGPGSAPKRVRELTEIEQTVMRRVMWRALDTLREAWSNVVAFEPKIERLELNPQFIQLVPPNDIVVTVGFALSIKGVRGRMTLCLPYLMLEPIIPKLSAHYWFSGSRQGPRPEQVEALRRRVERTEIPVVIRLGEAVLTVRELLEMEPGDVLQLDTPASGPLPVVIGDRTKFLGRPGRIGGKLAVEIVSVAPEGDESTDE